MSQDVCPIVSAEDRVRLEAIVADRNRAQKHVARVRIILHSAERRSVAEIARLADVSRPVVWRWQRRFAEAGVDGLLRDKTRKPANVMAWLERHPRWTFHFTPKSGPWLNAVETFFSTLTRQRLRRGVFRSVVDLQAAIKRYIEEHNDDPKPFTWTKPATAIIDKVNRMKASEH